MLIPFLAILSACSVAVPVKQTFPDAPQVLLEKCPDLYKADETSQKITDLLSTVVKNYGLYYECAAKQEGWIEWHKKQKQIFDRVNDL